MSIIYIYIMHCTYLGIIESQTARVAPFDIRRRRTTKETVMICSPMDPRRVLSTLVVIATNQNSKPGNQNSKSGRGHRN